MGSTFRLALIQLGVGSNKSENLARAVAKVADAARYRNLAPKFRGKFILSDSFFILLVLKCQLGRAGAQLVSLPECFNSPYGTQVAANKKKSKIIHIAKRWNIWHIGYIFSSAFCGV